MHEEGIRDLSLHLGKDKEVNREERKKLYVYTTVNKGKLQDSGALKDP